MNHEHVRIAVLDAATSGVENVPARRLESGFWELIRSPLYATQVAAGDVIKIIDSAAGEFEIVARGGNVSVQFYLGEREVDDAQATGDAAKGIAEDLAELGGRVDGVTAGLIACSIPSGAGFVAIEDLFETARRRHPGAQWQYGNVYDSATGEPLLWWEENLGSGSLPDLP